MFFERSSKRACFHMQSIPNFPPPEFPVERNGQRDRHLKASASGAGFPRWAAQHGSGAALSPQKFLAPGTLSCEWNTRSGEWNATLR